MNTEPNNSAEQEPTVRMAAYDHIAALHRKLEQQLTAAQEELASIRAENKRLLDQTSAGYVFNQMKRAWVALGHPAHEYAPHKFIEVCTALQSALAQKEKDGERLAFLAKHAYAREEYTWGRKNGMFVVGCEFDSVTHDGMSDQHDLTREKFIEEIDAARSEGDKT